MTPDELSLAIQNLLIEAAKGGQIKLAAEEIPPVLVERPRQREHGDWATNVALQLGKRAGMPPRDLAQLLVERLENLSGVRSAEVAGPGFINIRLEAAAAGELARTILQAGAAYGTGNSGQGHHVNLEYVSANPTGPIHIGGARWAAVGDSLARLLQATGAKVTREYYFNDHGAQIDRFSRSLWARANNREVPEDGYGGIYIDEIAQQVMAAESAAGRPNPVELPEEEGIERFRAVGVEIMFAQIKETLRAFGAEFDVFFHEQDLHESGAVDKALEKLGERGVIYEDGDATWVRTTDFGDDKDRVVIKSDGQAAYFAGDIAYYLDKRSRGADQCVYMLGADHHGYIGRMYAMARAFGDKAGVGENMEILIGQLVNVVRDGEPVRMSKRAGNIITLDDLVEAVGVDAARYALVRSSVDTTIDLDLALLAKASNENPVYYVQYAHSRTCQVARNAQSLGVNREDGFDPGQLDSEADAILLGTLARFPQIVAQAATLREPHRVARYLEELASAYHSWYGTCRVTPRGEDPVTDLHRARLWLNDATTQVLANGLDLLGVSAPQRM